MVEIRVMRDEQGRIIPRCGECLRPHPDMEFRTEDAVSEIWQCPECAFTATMRKPEPPRPVLVLDEISLS